jgi:predicted alpha/beta-hydrolase family hydrolase
MIFSPLASSSDRCARPAPGSTATPKGLAGTPGRLHVAGHSAGGHLAAMMAATDWRRMGATYPFHALAEPASARHVRRSSSQSDKH